MKYESYYFIKPSGTLRDRLKQANPDLAEFLDRPLMWTNQEGGVTAWTEEDYIAQVKLLFLLDLWSRYVIGAGEDKSLKFFLEETLGRPPFDESVFDRWWTVERFDGIDGSCEEAVERLNLDHPELIAHSNLPRVESWLSRLDQRVPA